MTAAPVGGITNTYVFNAENQMTSMTGLSVTTNYVYDGDGKRVQKTGSKLYWYGADGSVLDETDPSGSMTNTSFNEYIYFGGKRIARRDSAGNVLYYLADQLGTARSIAQVLAGQNTATLCYDADFYPYGGERTVVNICGQNYKFTGKERDLESGLDNFEARYDTSSLGRFMSPDPMGGQQDDPQSLNRYAYVRNNPLNLTDPTGLNFNLACAASQDNKMTCQGGLQGTTSMTTGANGKQTSTFTATEISNDKKGNLVDQKGNKYSGTFDGKNVNFTQTGSNQSSTGVWKQGTGATSGILGTGNFDHFDFTFMNHNSVQTLYAKFEFQGPQKLAEAALGRAGFVHWALGFHVGQTEYRQNVGGRDSFHFSITGAVLSPETDLPVTYGDMHDNEYYAGRHMLDHFWHDVLKQ